MIGTSTIGPVELILIRHGESVRNHASDLAHRGDSALLEWQMREEPDEASWPLTEAGRRQAMVTGEWIRSHLGGAFDAGYVSPFVRTLQTTDDLSLDVNWQMDDRIREREWGDYSAASPPYSASQYAADLGRCTELDWRSGFPGGESVLDMMPRVEAFLRSAWGATSAGRIIAVTHGGTIRTFQAILERLCAGPDCPDHRLSNCCVVHYRFDAVDLERWDWEGQVMTVHPTLPGEPETGWYPVSARTGGGTMPVPK